MLQKVQHGYIIWLLLFIIVGLAAIAGLPASYAQQGDRFNSPLPTPTGTNQEGSLFGPSEPPPTATPTPVPPPETYIALDYIAARESVPVGTLMVVNQHRREYDALGKAFWYVKTIDTESHHIYIALVDLSNQNVVELEGIEQAQHDAIEAKYGKFEPQLYDLLQTKGLDDEINIAV